MFEKGYHIELAPDIQIFRFLGTDAKWGKVVNWVSDWWCAPSAMPRKLNKADMMYKKPMAASDIPSSKKVMTERNNSPKYKFSYFWAQMRNGESL